MTEYIIEDKNFLEFKRQLYLEERSEATIQKYIRNVKYFFNTQSKITKEFNLKRKEELLKEKAIGTVNGIIAAVNHFFCFMGFYELKMKYCRQQKKIFTDENRELSKEEYFRLVRTAKENDNIRISLVLQTICSTGIRVSELKYITVEAVMNGYAEVSCKGKNRVILLPNKLRKLLNDYVKKQKLKDGSIFITKTGKNLDRSNIWNEMKKLCKKANVDREKVFPHNLRHLFARIFYNMEKDIAKLADLLGHSSIETTRIYIMESGNEHKKKLEKMHLIL